MSRLEAMRRIPRTTRRDDRGWLLKVLNGHEDHLRSDVGECYVTWSEPGQIRGNHYHPVTSEWFTVILGRARLTLCDPETGERASMELDGSEPVTVFVPAGLAHVLRTHDDLSALLVVYADHPYDPADTVPFGVL
jgi:dTDP-4-dehydrorhamnose 3,5-epimerase-like enzyme